MKSVYVMIEYYRDCGPIIKGFEYKSNCVQYFRERVESAGGEWTGDDFSIINDKLLLLIVSSVCLLLLVDFRRRSLRLARIPLVAGIIVYFFFRKKSEEYITDMVLKYLPSNPYPLWFGIAVFIIGYFFVLKLVRRRTSYGT